MDEKVIGTERLGMFFVAYKGLWDEQGLPSRLTADIYRDSRWIARMSSCQHTGAEAERIEALKERTRQWIAEYAGRPHNGDTDFGELF